MTGIFIRKIANWGVMVKNVSTELTQHEALNNKYAGC
jgi:hypothetical protein